MNYIKKGQIGTDFTNQLPSDLYSFEFSASAEKLNSLKNSWDNFRVFNWADFMPESVANELHTYYFHKHKDDWDLIIHPDPFHNYGKEGSTEPINEEGYYHMYLTKDNDPTLPERIENAQEVNFNNGFSYIYRRTEDFHPYLIGFLLKNLLI